MWKLVILGMASGLFCGVLSAILVREQGHDNLMIGGGVLGGVLGAMIVLMIADGFRK